MRTIEPDVSGGPLPLDRTAVLRSLLAERLGGDLAAFTKKAWSVLYPNRRLIWSWHYDYLAEILTLVKQRLLRVIINIPPRSLKSTLITILFPVWVWITEPEHNFLTASYSLDLSTEHSLTRRNLIQSAWFHSTLRDMRRTYQRAFKAVLFCAKFG